ncbi:MAG: hypothetical protein KBD04_05750 [Proteobacteria bacterium]|nr:hypothetical protein [Pseudomonadota bacterium]
MFIKGVFVLFALANITAGDIPSVEADKKVGHKKSCCLPGKFCPHSLPSFDFCQPLPTIKPKLKPTPTVTKEEPSFLAQGQASKPTSAGLMRKKKRKKRPVGTTIGTMVGGLEKDLNISSQAPESKLLTPTLLPENDSLNVLDAASQKGTSSKADLETVSASADNGKAISISINRTEEEFDEQEKKISPYQADGIIDNEQALVFLKTKRLKDVDTDTEEYQEEFFADEEDEEEDEINNENDSKIINIFAKPIKKKKINKTLRRHVI